MGFHFVERVYSEVTGTSPTAQAILAYLAHKADDAGKRKCFPSLATISAATHFKHTAINKALNELCDAKLLTWVSGGRHKGAGGRALSNEYTIHFSAKKSADTCAHTTTPSVRETDNASAATRIEQLPRDGQSISRETDTIINNHSSSQPSVIGTAEADTDDKKLCDYEEKGDEWQQKRAAAKEKAEEAHMQKKLELKELAKEAMRACGLKIDSDDRNYRIFYSTIGKRDFKQCLDVIMRFESEVRAGEHKNAHNLAAVLNSILALLPKVRE